MKAHELIDFLAQVDPKAEVLFLNTEAIEISAKHHDNILSGRVIEPEETLGAAAASAMSKEIERINGRVESRTHDLGEWWDRIIAIEDKLGIKNDIDFDLPDKDTNQPQQASDTTKLLNELEKLDNLADFNLDLDIYSSSSAMDQIRKVMDAFSATGWRKE